jgi:hypothetical protein
MNDINSKNRLLQILNVNTPARAHTHTHTHTHVTKFFGVDFVTEWLVRDYNVLYQLQRLFTIKYDERKDICSELDTVVTKAFVYYLKLPPRTSFAGLRKIMLNVSQDNRSSAQLRTGYFSNERERESSAVLLHWILEKGHVRNFGNNLSTNCTSKHMLPTVSKGTCVTCITNCSVEKSVLKNWQSLTWWRNCKVFMESRVSLQSSKQPRHWILFWARRI